MLIGEKELIITPSSFGQVMALKDPIPKALKENGIKIHLSSIDISPEKIEDMEVGEIGWVLEPILTLATDSNVRKHLFKCCERALIGKDQINQDFFEEPENRKYYYPIMTEVLKVNIAPFFGFASSVFSKLKGMTDKFLKSKSEHPKKT